MVGDQLETDIKGTRAFGLDTGWVNSETMSKALSVVPSHLQPHVSSAFVAVVSPDR